MSDLKGPFYIRQSRGGNWDNVVAETPEDTSFPADVLADIYDLHGQVSVWEVETLNAPEVGYLAAALHSGLGKLSDVTLRVVSDWRLTELGLKKKGSAGGSLDNVLNKSGKHWEIVTPTVKETIILAKALKHIDPIFFSQDDVCRLFAISLQERRISISKVSEGMWKLLIEGRYLKFVAE
jgi:hypothetical protein